MNELNKVTQAALRLRVSSEKIRREVLSRLAELIETSQETTLEANRKDLQNAGQLSEALKDRLRLTPERLASMVSSIYEVRDLPEVLGKKTKVKTRSDGLKIYKQKVPLGTIGMIFESRPNVIIEASSLALKSGNVIVLKGGKEAYYSNEILKSFIQRSLDGLLPAECVVVLDSRDRNMATQMLQSRFIDVMIPRGGQELIERVYNEARMPVIAHFQGLCHLYIDKSASKDAIEIVINSKASRSAVCNALETLLVHRDWLNVHGEKLLKSLESSNTQIRSDHFIRDQFPSFSMTAATDEDWSTEYLDNILSIKSVVSTQEACDHINQYGTKHTEGIVSRDNEQIEYFLQSVDASCLTINASTRFNDGSELGFGAELGISTSKFHAYGPMGLNELMAERFIVESDDISLR